MNRRIIIAGSRCFSDYEYLKEKMKSIINPDDCITIISGGAVGADMNGEKFAMEFGYRLEVFNAQWDLYGKSAGYIRNESMAIFASKENGVLCAFWNGKSRGTKSMIQLAKKYNLEIHIFIY